MTELAEELLLAIVVDEADGRRVAAFVDRRLAVEISALNCRLPPEFSISPVAPDESVLLAPFMVKFCRGPAC